MLCPTMRAAGVQARAGGQNLHPASHVCKESSVLTGEHDNDTMYRSFLGAQSPAMRRFCRVKLAAGMPHRSFE